MYTTTENIRIMGMTTMLRTAALTAGIILAFGSCSEDNTPRPLPDMPDTTPKRIGFGGNGREQEEMSRAGGDKVGLENMVQTFRVWGIKTMEGDRAVGFGIPQTVMDGYKVEWEENSANSTVSNTAGWEYAGLKNPGLPAEDKTQTIKYWDFSATSYRFYAIAPFEMEHKITNDAETGNPGITYLVEYNSATSTGPLYYSDLWLSDNGGDPFTDGTPNHKYTECADLQFHSPLVRVRFRYTFPADVVPQHVNINSSNFHNTDGDTPTSANMTITYPREGKATGTKTTTWNDIETGRLELTIPYEETAIHGVTEDNLERWHHVLPAHDLGHEQGSYELTANVNGKPKSATVPKEFMQWKTGYEYTYVFKITDAGIIFDHALEVYVRWQAGVSDDTEW